MTIASSPLTFSIITAAYNAADTLPTTLDSILAQDYPYIEHLIIDGNSTDETLQEIDRYIQHNSTRNVPIDIEWQSEPDNGIYDAMNKGLAKAKGHYLVFLNAGDRLHDVHTLSTLAAHIPHEGTTPAILYGNTHLVDHEGHFLRIRRLQPPEQLTSKSFKKGMLVCHQSFYVRRDIARKFPYDQQYQLSADFDWCIRLLQYAEQKHLPILNTHTVLTDYLFEGATTRHHKKSLNERRRIMEYHYGKFTTWWMHLYFILRHFIKK